MQKICVFTGTRAEYGLLKRLMEEIEKDSILKLQIIATGSHLSQEFGLTYKSIEKDGFHIDEKIEIVLSSDSSIGICKSMGLGIIGFSEALKRLNPDLLIILGDRYEALSAAIAATVCSIPIAHIHGGETTIGAIDEAFRHSITKMSHIHFTCAGVYKNRVIQLGEQPDRVYNVGSLGVENIRSLELVSLDVLSESLKFDFTGKYFLVTFHPATIEPLAARIQFQNLLDALSLFPEIKVVFTKANADSGGRIINKMIDEFADRHEDHVAVYASMGQLLYLSAMKYSSAVVGNSSSGIIEAPTFKIPTVNIGDRQKGRLRSASIIDCTPETEEISNALNMALSSGFVKSLKSMKNFFEKPCTAEMIKKIISETEFTSFIKKEFYDIN